MTNPFKYQNILLCTDYSKDAEASFVHAFDQTVKYGATLHILNVIPAVNPCKAPIFKTPMSKKKAIIESEKLDEQNMLQALGGLKQVYEKRCRDIIDHEFVVKIGSPDVEIINYAEANSIDMIIMGTAGRHATRRLTYIRTAANVSKFANCQVITIGSSPMH